MVGGTLMGAYRILHQIGEGGMGSVWLAEHTMLGRQAAIKVLHPAYSAQPDVVSRFFNEAKAATAISDPGIVQIFDFGTHVDGSAYIVMEALEGEGLDKRLARLGVLPVQDALRIMAQVASSLGSAHSRGIVHRDLKPENIFLVRDPAVQGGERTKILDFGIAKLVGDKLGLRTSTSAVMGTPTYMSPEQCRGAGQVDQRSDVYSAGCMLFTLMTGAPPFQADGAGELIAMHLREAPPAPSSRMQGLPPVVDQLVLRCLAKDPAQRFVNGTELSRALVSLANMQPATYVTEPMLPNQAIPPAVPMPTTLSGASGVQESHTGSRRGTLMAALGAATLLAAASVTFLVLRKPKTKPIDTASSASGSATESLPTPTAPTPTPAAPTPAPTTPTAAPTTPSAAPGSASVTATTTPPAAAPDPVAAPPPEPTRPDPEAVLASTMKSALGAFAAWAKTHTGAPCPDAAALGAGADPWGKPLAVTCTDQPADQIIGLVSAGPDGASGTDDDVASWSLGREVTNLVRGARWKVKVAKQPTPIKRPTPTRPPTPTPKSKIVDLDGDGIPDAR